VRRGRSSLKSCWGNLAALIFDQNPRSSSVSTDNHLSTTTKIGLSYQLPAKNVSSSLGFVLLMWLKLNYQWFQKLTNKYWFRIMLMLVRNEFIS